jgi:hypothetical protein
MATKITNPIKREVEINGEAHTVEIGPGGVIVTKKRHRKGRSHSWAELAPKPDGAE